MTNAVRKISIFIFFFVMMLCVVSNPYAYSQTSADSIGINFLLRLPDSKVKVDSIIAYTSRHRKEASAEVLFDEAFRLVDELHYNEVRARLLDIYGVFKRDFSKYSEALELHKKSLELARKANDVRTEIYALNNMGVVYRRLDENTTALNYHFQALKLAEKVKDDYSASVSLNSIGNIHIALGNYADAIKYFEQCLPLAYKANNNLGIAMNLNNIGEAYESLGILDSAESYYQKSLGYNEKIRSMKGIAISYNSLGNISRMQKKFSEAVDLYKKALNINKEIGDMIYTSITYNRLGEVYFLQKKLQDAEIMFRKGLELANEIGSKSEAKTAYEGLMKVNEMKGNLSQALEYSKLFKLYGDSLALENNNRYVRQMEAIYQNEKEQNRIAFLETKRRKDWIILLGAVVLIVLLLTSGVLYYLRRRLIERNQVLQRELEIRSQIATDLHDDMGSTLSSIHIFSELLRKSGGNSEDLLNKIEANAKDTLEALDDIIWLVKPSNDKFSNLGSHINEYAIPLFESKEIDFNVNFPDSIAELPLPMEVRRNIFLILKESVNNLIKYSKCTKAGINAEIVDDNILFEITDNGIGFDPEMTTNRNGLKNMRARATRINAVFNINSSQGNGTKISLEVPIKDAKLFATL